MFNPDVFRRQPLVYRTAHKRWVLMAPYVSIAFWVAAMLSAQRPTHAAERP